MKNSRTPKAIQDSKDDLKPSLRISHIVYGRESRVNNGVRRVYYFVDPKGKTPEKRIPEEVVLIRWRKRFFEGFSFSGARLHPRIWRAIHNNISSDPKELVSLQLEALENRRKKHPTNLPPANILHALLQITGEARLKLILDRHNAPERAEKFGTPDLFLFATERKTGLPSIARFVEVKKPEEPLSKGQTEEITFLQSIGLHARILRLKERS